MARHPRKRLERGIYEETRPTGIRLIVRVQVGGKDINRTLPTKGTIEEARRVRHQLEAQTQTAPRVAAMTVRSYAQAWIRRKAAVVRPSTLDRYVDTLGRQLLPAVVVLNDRGVVFGDLAVTDVRRPHVAEWVSWACRQKSARGQPYANDTLTGWWQPVRAFLRDMSADFGTEDPTRRLAGPRSNIRNVREGRTLTARQLAKLFATVDRSWPNWSAEVRTLAMTGMRPGELYELRWSDVNEGAGVIEVQRAHCHGVVDRPKSGKPRLPALTPALAKLLARHRLMMSGQGRPIGSDDLIFPAKNGLNRGSQALGKMLRFASLEAGIPFKVGALVLRRTFNTLASELGAPAVVLRDQMGHATAAMTHRYAGVHVEAKRSMVEKIEAAVCDEA